jgi:hypothetical protein
MPNWSVSQFSASVTHPCRAGAYQRGRHALAAHVADRDGDAVQVDLDHIIEIAADLARRDHVGISSGATRRRDGRSLAGGCQSSLLLVS